VEAISPTLPVTETSAIPSPTPTPTPSPTAVPSATPTTSPPTPTPTFTPTVTPTPSPSHLPPPTRIVIPAIGVDAPVVEVRWKVVKTENGFMAEWETADYAAGHHFNSANPGENGNVVISGHHNIKGKVFNRLWELKPGDEIKLYNARGEIFTYVVNEVLLLREKGASEEERRAHARYMNPTSDPTLTLISCWPPWSNTHRVIVIAKLKEGSVANKPDKS
ncbi:MAG TPA: sortase, partial [Chloroflexi bacterium]|nr:sortase [Chloroflexota bacterium]